MKRVVTIGGGGGQATILRALVGIPNVSLTAIVNMVDDGGSTGALMRAYGVQSMGDARNCLSALCGNESTSNLLSHRWSNGPLKGHVLGNILLATLEKNFGSFSAAIEAAARFVHVSGTVIPMCATSPVLVSELKDGSVIYGQSALVHHLWSNYVPIKQLRLQPITKLLPSAAEALEKADLVIIPPGDLYSSIAPFFLLDNTGHVLEQSKARFLWFPNSAYPKNHTHYATVGRALEFLQSLCGSLRIDTVILPKNIPASLTVTLTQNGYVPIDIVNVSLPSHIKKAIAPLIAESGPFRTHFETIKRSPVYYNNEVLRETLTTLITH